MKIKFFFFIILCLSCLTACRHVEYVAVPEVRYVNSTDTIRDSIDRWHTHYEYLRGDSVRIVDTFYCDRWHLERHTDTLILHIPVIDTAATNALRAELDAAEASVRRLTLRLVLLAIVFLLWMGWRIYCRCKGNVLCRNISTD